MPHTVEIISCDYYTDNHDRIRRNLKVRIDGIEIDFSVVRIQGGVRGGVYTFSSTNKQVMKDPDWKEIRIQIGVVFRDWAKEHKQAWMGGKCQPNPFTNRRLN
jgi:hypothetical protein